MGFGHFLTLLMVLADKALLMALAKRWSPIMQTFHLPMEEIEVPPIDFYMMMGLSMDGMPPPILEDFNPTIKARRVSFPHGSRTSMSGLQMTVRM